MRYYEIIAETSADIIERNFDKQQAENNSVMSGVALEPVIDDYLEVEKEFSNRNTPGIIGQNKKFGKSMDVGAIGSSHES